MPEKTGQKKTTKGSPPRYVEDSRTTISYGTDQPQSSNVRIKMPSTRHKTFDSRGREYYADPKSPSHRGRPSESELASYQQHDEDEQQPDLALQELSHLQLAEQIFRVRKHGISVQLDSKAIEHMNELGRNRQLPLIRNNHVFDDENTLVDVHNPHPQEMQRLNDALVTLISLKAQLDIPGFDVERVAVCDVCTVQFPTQAQKDDHQGGGRLKCQIPNCQALLLCKTRRDEHIRQAHQPRPTADRVFANSNNPRPDPHWQDLGNQQSGIGPQY